jgi:D-alanine-D-alanine ligase
MRKLNVAIIFGGKSAEHEVSLQSAKNVYEAIDREKYNPILIGIDKDGHWTLPEQSRFLLNTENPKLIALNRSRELVTFAPESGGRISSVAGSSERSVPDGAIDLPFDGTIDVAFPILHGPMGEDGTVQGLLKLANIPFVGASVLGSAVGMDKDVMKRLLRDAGIPTARFIALRSDDPVPAWTEATEKLGTPLFVKPANMGSSVGVAKAQDQRGYLEAVEQAFRFDLKIVIEETISGRELECAVLGNSRPEASVVGEIVPSREFYSYEAKYIDEHGAVLSIPADIPPETSEEARALAVRAFTALSCEGLGRVDMFLKPDGRIVVNEINTIPGFTRISMYPKLWEASGVSYTELIDKLIRLAIERFEKEKRLRTAYL